MAKKTRRKRGGLSVMPGLVAGGKKKRITKKDIAIIIAKELNDDSIDENSDMGSISNWDSLSHISVILAIEKEIGFSLSSKEIAQSTSVKSIYNIANNLK